MSIRLRFGPQIRAKIASKLEASCFSFVLNLKDTKQTVYKSPISRSFLEAQPTYIKQENLSGGLMTSELCLDSDHVGNAERNI